MCWCARLKLHMFCYDHDLRAGAAVGEELEYGRRGVMCTWVMGGRGDGRGLGPSFTDFV